jgi:PhoPQ-activated pathogenicity-related protein
VQDKPAKVLLWQATNPKARDFRLETIGAVWTSKLVTGENGIYSVAMAEPAAGYTAFFLELTYPGVSDAPMVFTTEVMVTPNTYPYDDPWVTKRGGRLRPR